MLNNFMVLRYWYFVHNVFMILYDKQLPTTWNLKPVSMLSSMFVGRHYLSTSPVPSNRKSWACSVKSMSWRLKTCKCSLRACYGSSRYGNVTWWSPALSSTAACATRSSSNRGRWYRTTTFRVPRNWTRSTSCIYRRWETLLWTGRAHYQIFT